MPVFFVAGFYSSVGEFIVDMIVLLIMFPIIHAFILCRHKWSLGYLVTVFES